MTQAHALLSAQRVRSSRESFKLPKATARQLCVLGLIDAGLGRKEEALRQGRRAVELLPVEKDAIHGTGMVEYLAMIAAWVGEKDLACEQLAIAVRPPSPLDIRPLETAAVLGPPARRSALRKNRCLTRAEARRTLSTVTPSL